MVKSGVRRKSLTLVMVPCTALGDSCVNWADDIEEAALTLVKEADAWLEPLVVVELNSERR